MAPPIVKRRRRRIASARDRRELAMVLDGILALYTILVITRDARDRMLRPYIFDSGSGI